MTASPKKMKITLENLLKANPSLGKMLMSPELPAKTSFLLKGVIKQVSEHLSYYNLEKEKLVLKHKGVPNPKTDRYDFPTPEHNTLFESEMKELISAEVELVYSPISVQMLEGVKLTALDMDNLDGFVVA
jgi:hypothetical protein